MEPAAIHERLAQKFGEGVTAFQAEALQPWVVVAPDAIAEVAAYVKALQLSQGVQLDSLPPRLQAEAGAWLR